jgi:hypothetical protein
MKQSRSSPLAEHKPRPASSWVSWVLLGGFLLMITLWLGGRPALRWWHSQQAGGFLTAARAEMENEKWGEAARWIREASQAAPDDPAVVRAIADFQIRTHSHPSDVIQTLRHLASTQDVTAEDLAKLARAQIDLGSHDAARKTLALLPESVRANDAQAAEAEAYLLKMERRDSEADARLRAALTTGGSDAQTPLKMAILDLKQPHPDVHHRGRNSLWILAQEGGVNAADAISILASDPSLTAIEAGRLMKILEASYQADEELRYLVLTALVRLRPEEREVILNRETQSVTRAAEPQRLVFARWLASLNEHKRLLAFLPPGLKWKDMPADMALLKLEALAQADQWNDLHAALNRDMEKVLGTVSFNLWQARVVSAQGGGVSRVQQHLNLAFDAVNPQTAVQVAEAAEKLGALDLAAGFYQSTAALASSPQFRIALLEKAYALHLSARDTYAMLQVAAEVAGLTPGNLTNAFRADYLALLVGESIELVASRIAGAQASADTEFSSRLVLLKAMAAHRLHAPLPEPGSLKELQHLAWEPGHRAVLAAMLATRGDAAMGFQIAEKISTALLLPEEKKFLTLAR